VNPRALLLTLVVVALAGVVILLVDGDGGGGPTAEQVEQRLLEGWSIGGNRPNSTSCRSSKKEDYFDCRVLFGRPASGDAGGSPIFGYDIRVPGTAPERQVGQWLSEELSRWSSAATAYNATLQRCVRQPNPVRGFMSACARKNRIEYQRATARLRLLGALVHDGDGCARVLSQARSLAAGVTKALTREFRATNPPVGLINKANRVTRHNVKSYDQLASTLLRICV
jgi:hypothetical protein